MPSDYLIPYLVSNLVGIGLILVALKWSGITRVIFAVIFFGASIVNTATALRAPEVYVQVYGEFALLPIYRQFIYGFFSQYTTSIVLAIAGGQFVVAVLLFLAGRSFALGIAGGIVFLLAISPLGTGSAFPATLFMAGALFIIYRKRKLKESQAVEEPINRQAGAN